MNIIIEKAVSSDAKALLAYLKQVGGESDNLTFGSEGLPFTVEAEADYLSQWERSKDGIVLLAKENGTIVGNASLQRLPRRASHRGELAVSVRKTHWNRGIGDRLLRELFTFAEANGFDGIDLQVRSDNAAAIHLYEKHGFQKLGTHPAYFVIRGKDISVDYMYRAVR